MVCCLCGDPSSTLTPGDLDAVARACSPRVAPHGTHAVIFDVDGLSRACGPPEIIAREVTLLAQAQGLAVRVALAGTMTAAWVLAHARAGTTVVPAGAEAAALASVPLGWLGTVAELDRAGTPDMKVRANEDHFATFARWGLRSCGDLAALPRADLHARMGDAGVRLHQAACGEDVVPLTSVDESRHFTDRMVLEWPIDGLEPLSFVLARQCERLVAALERADRGAIAITTQLTLVDKTVHTRVLELPAPLRDARVWRTLVLLDLESHPPPAAIDAVALSLEVTPGHILQGSLFAHAVPSEEDLSTLMARLGALMGESRVGAPLVLDTFDGRQVGMGPFRLRFRGSEVPGFRGSGSGVQRFTGSAPLHRRTAKPEPRKAGSSEPEPGNPRTSEPGEPREP